MKYTKEKVFKKFRAEVLEVINDMEKEISEESFEKHKCSANKLWLVLEKIINHTKEQMILNNM